ncbi:MAG TPA: dihydropteroate synthase [Thermoplasmatales archaeon]|nr:dihydropteroate synthase [Thermoplasmatales archaeon]
MLRIIRNEIEGKKELERIGVNKEAISIMLPKMFHLNIKFKDVPPQDAIILKQEMLSIGGDTAISEKALPPYSSKTDVLLMGNEKQIKILANKLKKQYKRLHKLGEEIENIIENIRKKTEIYIGKRRFEFGKKTYVMGILNVTPDSFYNGGKYFSIEEAIKRAKQIEKEGADIIDVGGESTRPFSKRIDEKEEMERVLPIIEEIKKEIKIPVSIDTYKPKVAEKAIEKGADMVNDIMALLKENMADVVKEYNVPVCIMHMKGTPENMQKIASYEDVVEEIYSFLKNRIEFAISSGIDENKIIIDPGIGFGKRTGSGIEDNCEIISRLMEIKSIGKPVLIGISRKTFIGNITSSPVNERLEGSLGAEAVAIANGADIIRCHDVYATKKMAKIVDAIVRGVHQPEE